MPSEHHLQDDPYSFYQLLGYLWSKKVLVASVVIGFLGISSVWVITLPNQYMSSTLLAPADDQSSGNLAGMSSQLGGLASIAGINLGAASSDKATIALQIMQSREFLATFIEQNQVAIPLVAGKEWDSVKGQLILDEEIYSESLGQWTRERKGAISTPGQAELYNKFTNILSVEEDKNSSMVRVEIEFLSPELAQSWLSALVNQLNERMRTRDVEATKLSMNYLEEQLDKTDDIDMRKLFFTLIQEQLKQLMMAEISPEYVFETLDPAYYPPEPAGPKRLLIVLFAGFLGGALVVFGLMLAFFVVPRKVL